MANFSLLIVCVRAQQQRGSGPATCAVPPLVYDPLDEPSPLGLHLRKSPSLLDLIQMRLTQQKAVKLSTLGKKNQKGAAASGAADKLKAMNFPASLLRIGTWEVWTRKWNRFSVFNFA